MSNIMKRPEKDLAVELFATQPDLTVAEVAAMIGVTPKAVKTWRENINFMEAIYDRYMVEFGGELPAVLMAMVREAKSGNVQAGRLVLEHSGKLVKNVNVTIDSPFEKFMKKVEVTDVIDAEIIEEGMDVISEEYQSISLPERKKESPIARVREEKKKIKISIKEEVKRQDYNRKQKIWYEWKKRAKAVGIEPLKAKRPTKGQRKTWEDKIVRRENGEE
tara:strand:+ start:195 stop:851 length:657 start_codon:yes stop_codon:yes gene_type:complete